MGRIKRLLKGFCCFERIVSCLHGTHKEALQGFAVLRGV